MVSEVAGQEHGRGDEGVTDIHRHRDEDAERRGVALAKARHRRADDEHLPERDHHPDRGQAGADHARRPAELGDAIKAPRHRIYQAGDLPQHQNPRDPAHAGQAAQGLQRAERIGAPPVEGAAAFGGQRFGKDEQAIEHVGGGEQRRGDKRCARPDLAQKAANRRSGDEADTERRSHKAEIARPLGGGGDVGDRGLCRGIAAAEDARQGTRDEQPGQGLDDGQQRIVDRESAEREQQHAPPPETVRQIAEDRRGDKSCDRHDQADPRPDLDRAGQVDRADFHYQLRQHRHDDAEADRVHENGCDDEGNGAGCGQAMVRRSSARAAIQRRESFEPINSVAATILPP